MKLYLFAVYDKIACVFFKPFTEINHASAMRVFDQSIKDKENMEDYDLYVLAEFDDNNGQVDPTKVESIRKGLDVKSHHATVTREELVK